VARILFLNPSRWGRGITPIWIASHTAVLRGRGHEVGLFDATFFRDWSQNENRFNTENLQYRPSAYESRIVFDERPVVDALQAKVDAFAPDFIFWAAISSHIHGEGEYAAIQFGSHLMDKVRTSAVTVCGGLQPTAAPAETARRFPGVRYFVAGESEFAFADLVDAVSQGRDPRGMPGVIVRDGDGIVAGPAQPLIADLDRIGPYDFGLFDDQVFLRPYNGDVVRAVDYELSRGCPFTCSYCVETVIQRYYGQTEATPRGALKSPRNYLRGKSAARIHAELKSLHRHHGVTFVRCQDTNFLTIEREVLEDLADLLAADDIPLSLYIETRPEGINPRSVELLKRLKVDGVGMGIELSGQEFREALLNRFANQNAIFRAFEMLRASGIRRTAYNIIGLPSQNEQSILDTVTFNRQLDPDNVTVAFYSPYLGTGQQKRGADEGYFLDYEFDLDSQLRTMTRHEILTPALLAFYKRHFVRLVKEGFEALPALKRKEGIA